MKQLFFIIAFLLATVCIYGQADSNMVEIQGKSTLADTDVLIVSGSDTVYWKITYAALKTLLNAIYLVDADSTEFRTASDVYYEGVITNSAGLLAALSDETGTGVSVFSISPSLTTPDLGTPSLLTLTNATGLPYSSIVDVDSLVGKAINDSSLAPVAQGDIPYATGSPLAWTRLTTAAFADSTEDEFEAVLDLEDLQGATTDAQVPPDITLDQFPASGANPTTNAAGEIAVDTDDHFIEFYSDASKVLGSLYSRTITVVRPDSVQSETDGLPIWQFDADAYPHGVTLKDIIVATSVTCTDDLNFEEWSNNGTSWSVESTTEAITLSGTRTEDDGTLSDADFDADDWLAIDFDGSPTDISYLNVTFTYWINPGD